MTTFREVDAISGKHARASINVNGEYEELFVARSLEATIEKNKVDVPILGRTNTAKRSAGWSGSGTLNIYYVTSAFRQKMRDYLKTGQDFWFDILIENEQPGSAAGKQTVTLKGCNLDSVIAARFDATSDDMLEEELPFTFNDYDINTPFTPLKED